MIVAIRAILGLLAERTRPKLRKAITTGFTH